MGNQTSVGIAPSFLVPQYCHSTEWASSLTPNLFWFCCCSQQALNANKAKTWSLDDNSKPDTRGYMGWGPRDDNSWGGTPAGMSRETPLLFLPLPIAQSSAVVLTHESIQHQLQQLEVSFWHCKDTNHTIVFIGCILCVHCQWYCIVVDMHLMVL